MRDEAAGLVAHTVHIDAEPELVWRYWTDPGRLCRWWASSARLDPRPGGEYHADLGGGAVMVGEFVELVPYRRLVFRFGWEGAAGGDPVPAVPPRSSLVEVTLTPEAGGTRLALRHTGLVPEETARHEEGWQHFLGVLADTVLADDDRPALHHYDDTQEPD